MTSAEIFPAFQLRVGVQDVQRPPGMAVPTVLSWLPVPCIYSAAFELSQKRSCQSSRVEFSYPGSIKIVFARWRQCAPHLVHPNVPAPYRFRPMLSRFEYVDRRTRPGTSWAGPFSSSKLSLHMLGTGPGPCLIHGSLGPRESSSQTIGSAVFAALTVVTD